MNSHTHSGQMKINFPETRDLLSPNFCEYIVLRSFFAASLIWKSFVTINTFFSHHKRLHSLHMRGKGFKLRTVRRPFSSTNKI